MYSVSYYILISNIYILFIFFYHYLKNRQWFVRYYIIGKTMQVAGLLMFGLIKSHEILDTWYPNGFLIIAGFSFEIFGIISYDSLFNKKISRQFIFATGLLFLLLISSVRFHKMHVIVLDAGTFFFFSYGGVLLLKKKDKSRFRPIIGYTFIIYSLFRLVGLIVSVSTNMPEMPPPDMEMVPHAMPQPELNFNIGDTSRKLMYLVTVISSISYLIILKEQDELAIARVNKQMAKENKSLRALDEEKNKFLSIVAHDLKGPIGTLANITEMLVEQKKRLEREDYEKWLTIIKESTTRTYTFLNNLLQWARSESGNLTPKPVMLNVKELATEIIKLMEVYAGNKHISLVNNCPDNAMIYADKEMISTVLRNLISNGIKFTDKDGTISVTAKVGDTTTISVTDTGVGISAEKVKKIFDLDSQYSTKGTQNENGTGLGLKLSYEFVEKNNGKMWVKSEPGKGSSFYFSLPKRKSS